MGSEIPILLVFHGITLYKTSCICRIHLVLKQLTLVTHQVLLLDEVGSNDLLEVRCPGRSCCVGWCYRTVSGREDIL